MTPPAPPTPRRRPARRAVKVAPERGRHDPVQAAVAAPNPYAAQAGTRVATAGGNAVDAALAAVLVAMVSEPGVAAVGGGAFVTVAPVGGRAVTVDGTVSMPGRGLPPEAFGGGMRPVFMEYGPGTSFEAGHGSVATPGALPAFELAHRRFGRLPWAEVVAPAAERARAGFVIGAAAGRYLEYAREPLFGHDAEVRAALHGPDGRPLRTGDTMCIAGLADFLDRVATEGAAALHAGDVAAAIADDMAAHGGLLNRDDLASYRARVRPALRVRLRDWELATNPAPAVGGAVLAAMLVLLEARCDGTAGGVARLAALLDVQRAVLSHRIKHLEVAADRAAAVDAMLEAVAASGTSWARSPSTVNVSVVDGEGNACAITSSAGYGAGVSVPGTGVWLNNCLGEHELNRAGVHALPPGQRLVSNMAPTVGRRPDGTVLAVGSPGADRIATAVLQVLLALVCEGATLQQSIDRPRVHVTCDDDGTPRLVEHEADVPRPPGVAGDLPWREHPSRSMFFGGVTAAMLEAGSRLEAAADPRREGAVSVTAATSAV